MLIEPSIEVLLTRVAQGMARLKGMNAVATPGERFAIQFDEWDWEVGVGLHGLLRHAVQQQDHTVIDAIARWYDWQIGRGLPPRQINSTAPMLPLVQLIDHVDRPDWEALVADWAQWLMDGLPKTAFGGFQHTVKEGPNEGQLWDDTLFMACLFLARAGQRLGRRDWVDEALYQFLLHARFLTDPVTGLWFHGWTFIGHHNYARALWGRGNAWVTVAIPELLALVDDVPASVRRMLQTILRAQVDSLKTLQGADGLWHTLLDDPASPVETSATAGFAYGILRGIEAGLLDAGDAGTARRALNAVLARIDADGIVQQVSDGTPMGHTLDFYRRIPNVPAPYGQALVMLLLVEISRSGERVE